MRATAALVDRNWPARVTALAGVCVRQCAVGEDHCAALSATGAVYTWGSNLRGQLGYAGGRQLLPKRVEALNHLCANGTHRRESHDSCHPLMPPTPVTEPVRSKCAPSRLASAKRRPKQRKLEMVAVNLSTISGACGQSAEL